MPDGSLDRFRDLPAGARRYLVATLANMIGNGMQFAFLFIYLHDVRGFSGAVSGAVMTAGSLTALAVSTLGGAVADRVGAKPALLAAVLLSMLPFSLWPLVHDAPFAFVVSIAAGVTQGLAFPAQQAFSAVIVSHEQRPAISSWLRVFLNLGAAIGATIAGFTLHVSDPASFTRMFLANTATFAVYAAVVRGITPLHDAAARDRSLGYREVLRDRFFVGLLPLDFAAGLSFGLVFLLMPTTFLRRLGASESAVGLVVMSGAVAVILTQLGVARLVRGRARMLALAAMFAMFCTSFAFGVASVGRPLWVAISCVVCAQVIGGVGESFLGPTRVPLTADLAPAPLIGRYFGLQTMLFQGGFGLATAVGGAGLDVTLRGTWLFGGALAALALWWSVTLDRHIPVAVRLSP